MGSNGDNTLRGRMGDVRALARAARQIVRIRSDGGHADNVHAQRQLVAEFFKLMARQAGKPAASEVKPVGATVANQAAAPAPRLSPRERQTLNLLLRGDGEKQIAAKLKLSQHTVHIYVKALHKHFAVSSRAELLARFIPQAPATADSPRFK